LAGLLFVTSYSPAQACIQTFGVTGVTVMDEQQAEQLVDELFPFFEAMETRIAAVLQFLKAKGLATDEDLAPYLEQAGDASNVIWRAARIRTMSLLSSAIASQKAVEKADSQSPESETAEGAKQKEAEKQEDTKDQKSVPSGRDHAKDENRNPDATGISRPRENQNSAAQHKPDEHASDEEKNAA
jgi:hypothetical protein